MIPLESILQNTGWTLQELLLNAYVDFRVFSKYLCTLEPLDIQPFHVEFFRMFMGNKRTVIEAPRGSGKTTVLGVLTPLYVSMFNRNKSFLIVSKTEKQAKDIVAKIQQNINSNELLRKLVPNDFSLTWTRTDINTSTGCRVLARPYNESVLGLHVDYALADEASTYRDTDVFFQYVTPCVNAKQGNVMAIGTPKTHFDLIAQLKDKLKHPDYVVRTYRAVLEGGAPLWGKRYAREQLDFYKRDLGLVLFNSEYMCSLVDEGSSVIPFSLIAKAYDASRTFIQRAEDRKEYYCGVDFAMSPTGDYSVFTVVEKERDAIRIAWMDRVRGLGYRQQEELLLSINDRFKPVRFLLDESTFGRPFVEALRSRGIPVEGFYFTPDNRNTVINNVIRLFSNGQVRIPRGEDHVTLSVTDALTKELTEVTPGTSAAKLQTFKTIGAHDDCVMSFALAAFAATRQQRFVSHWVVR